MRSRHGSRSRVSGDGTSGAPASASRRPFLAIASIATTALVAISALGGSVAKYRWSALFLVPLVWVVFRLRARLALRAADFALFAVAVLAHDLGAFGWYQRSVAGLQYDWLVHFLFGVVGGLVVAGVLRERLGLRGLALGLLTLLAVGGMGAVHEIIEAGSTWLLGPEHGMLHVGPENPYDTQEDMLCNLLGTSLALGLRRAGRGRAQAGTDASP